MEFLSSVNFTHVFLGLSIFIISLVIYMNDKRTTTNIKNIDRLMSLFCLHEYGTVDFPKNFVHIQQYKNINNILKSFITIILITEKILQIENDKTKSDYLTNINTLINLRTNIISEALSSIDRYQIDKDLIISYLKPFEIDLIWHPEENVWSIFFTNPKYHEKNINKQKIVLH